MAMEINRGEGCVGCKGIGLPCLGGSCTARDVKHYYCDECGREKTLYRFAGMELCGKCVLQNFDIIAGSEKI